MTNNQLKTYVTGWRSYKVSEQDLREWAEKRADDAGRLARQLLAERFDTNQRMDAIIKALDWAIAEIEGRTRYDNEDQRENALGIACTTLATFRNKGD